jgi:hypothetical protein
MSDFGEQQEMSAAMLVPMDEKLDEYVVQSCGVGDLTAEEKTRCLQLIGAGEAVDVEMANRDFPRSARIAVARKNGEIVGVASIKPIREDYATGRAMKAHFEFDPGTPELGYAVVDELHRGNRLSSWMAAALTTDGGGLFATTSDKKMKSALKGAGFKECGKAWKGRRGDSISLWVRS